MYGGIDSSSSYLGIAAVRWHDDRLVPVYLGAPVVMRGHTVSEWYQRLRPPLQEAVRLGVHEWLIEKPPPTAKKDTGHARQAPIGFGVGFPGGMCAALLCELGATYVDLVEPGEWRPTMLRIAGENRISLHPGNAPRPARAPAQGRKGVQRTAEGGFRLDYPCEHFIVCSSLEGLRNAPQACTICTVPGRAATSRARDVRDEWKRKACTFVGGMWPDWYRILRDSLRSRSDTPDHRRAGLADVCEAAGVAVHLAEASRLARTTRSSR